LCYLLRYVGCLLCFVYFCYCPDRDRYSSRLLQLKMNIMPSYDVCRRLAGPYARYINEDLLCIGSVPTRDSGFSWVYFFLCHYVHAIVPRDRVKREKLQCIYPIPQLDASLGCESTDSGLVHRLLWLFTSEPKLVFICITAAKNI